MQDFAKMMDADYTVNYPTIVKEINWIGMANYFANTLQIPAINLGNEEELMLVKVVSNVWNLRVVTQDNSVPADVMWKAAQVVLHLVDLPNLKRLYNLPEFLNVGVDLALLFTRAAVSARRMADATEGMRLVHDLLKRMQRMLPKSAESVLRHRMEANMAASRVLECDMLSRSPQTNNDANDEQAFMLLSLAMISPGLIPSQLDYLARVAFNAGLNRRKEKKFHLAVRWFRESYRASQASRQHPVVTTNPPIGTNIMCLLATTYLEWGEEHWDKAVGACDVGLKEKESFDLLQLRLKALLMSKAEVNKGAIRSALRRIRKLPELTCNDLIKVILLLNHHEEHHLAKEMVDVASASHDNTNWLKFRFTYYIGKSGSHDKALSVLEEVARRPTISYQDDFHAMIDLASHLALEYHKDENFLQASCWYAALYDITSKLGDLGAMIQLRCNQAECLIEEGKMDEAEAIIANVEDVSNKEQNFWQFPILIVKLKLAMLQEKEEEMLELAVKLDCSLPAFGSQRSLEAVLSDIAVKAASLGKLHVCVVAMKKVAAALEPLTRLKVQKVIMRSYLQLCNEKKDLLTDNLEPLMTCVEQFADFFDDVLVTAAAVQRDRVEGRIKDVNIDDELKWLAAIAWNVAREGWSSNYTNYRLYLLAYESYRMVENHGEEMEMALALLMAVAAGCSLFDSLSEERRLQIAQNCLSMVWTCRGLCKRCHFWPDGRCERFLVLYEFRCRCVLGSGDAEDIALEALSSAAATSETSGLDVQALQILASLACYYEKYTLARKALELALRKMEEMYCDEGWGGDRGAVLHSLLSLISQDLAGNFDKEDEAFRAFMIAATYIKKGKDFPRVEATFIEDYPSTGVFTTRLKGFDQVPTDHYLRPFYLEYERNRESNKRYCLRNTPSHKIFMNYVTNFFLYYRDKPKFMFAFHGELSHGDLNMVEAADEDLLEMVQGLHENNMLNDTLLIIMSNHGARFSSIRETQQGKQEERNPMFSYIFPPWFSTAYPEAYNNFVENSNVLTTPFDVHATLRNVLHFTYDKPADLKNRSINLFQKIPKERTCDNAGIETHWCSCLSWNKVPTTDAQIQEAAHAVVDFFNGLTESDKDICETLTLAKVVWAAKFIPNNDFLKFRQNADVDGFIPDLTDNTKVEEIYQIHFHTNPGNGHFEVTVKRNLKENTYDLRESDISRVNKYGSQADCVKKKNLEIRQYCYCK